MTANPSIFRRAYDTVALFALLNLLAIFGLGFLLVSGGTLDAEKARRIVAVLRGEEPAAGDAEDQEEGSDADTSETVGEIAAESQVDMEILRRESERIKAELDQRLALNNSILLRVMNEREAFKQQRGLAQQQQQASVDERREDGFKKQIAIYESLAPKVAVEHMLALPDPDEAAKILLQLQTRKAKKIVEAAKRGDQMQKMKVILQRLREVAPDRSAEIESTEP